MNESFGMLPPMHSTLASYVDWLYMFLFWGSVAFLCTITVLVIYFSFRYHRSRHPKAAPAGHNTLAEITWTFAPLLLLAFLFHEGFKGYVHSTTAPEHAIVIRVRASQWRWEFEYPNGSKELGTLRVPVNRPVRLVMSSEDVIHSFYIPDFRVKKDVVPGLYTTLWFQSNDVSPRGAGGQREGFQIFCTEYCGTGHSSMLGKVIVMPFGEWDRYMREGPSMPGGLTPARWGQQLYGASGCSACHSTDGSAKPGPTWHNLFGSTVALEGGHTVTADENYIRESVLTPQAKVVAGFNSVLMPPYAGTLADRQLDAIIQYMRCLSDEERSSVQGCPQ